MGRARALFTGVSEISITFLGFSWPSSVASSSRTSGFSFGDAPLEPAWISGKTSEIGVRLRPSELCLLSLPATSFWPRVVVVVAAASDRSRLCIALTSFSPSSSHRTDTTELELDRADLPPPNAETPEAVDGGRREEEPPLEAAERVDDGRPLVPMMRWAESAESRLSWVSMAEGGGPRVLAVADASETDEVLRRAVSLSVDGRPRPNLPEYFFLVVGSSGRGAPRSSTGLLCGLRAPASKLLPEYLPNVFSFFGFFFFFPSFVFVVRAVAVFVAVFVSVFVRFVVGSTVLSSLVSRFAFPMLAQLFIRARERMERIARTAMDPDAPLAWVPGMGGGARYSVGPAGTVSSVAVDESEELRGGELLRRTPESRELKRVRESAFGERDFAGSGAVGWGQNDPGGE